MNRNDCPQGTHNVLLNLGFDEGAELSAKAALALKFNELIDRRGLSQIEAAAITGMTHAESIPGAPLQAAEHFARTADARIGIAGPACRNRRAACATLSVGRHHGRRLTAGETSRREACGNRNIFGARIRQR
nr:helix-turn-helix domain-containing protein [Burkholderia sp. AU31624]